MQCLSNSTSIIVASFPEASCSLQTTFWGAAYFFQKSKHLRFWNDNGRIGPPEESHSQKYSLKYEAHTKKDMIERNLGIWIGRHFLWLFGTCTRFPGNLSWRICQVQLLLISSLGNAVAWLWHVGTSAVYEFSLRKSLPDVSTYLPFPITTDGHVPCVYMDHERCDMDVLAMEGETWVRDKVSHRRAPQHERGLRSYRRI